MNSHALSRSHTRRQAAMTLIELMVAVGVLALAVVMIARTISYTARSFQALGNYGDLDRDSRNALDTISRDIRKSAAVTSSTSSGGQIISITLSNQDATSFSYTWSPSDQTLTRTYGGQSSTLLKGCTSLQFNFSQRNPSNNFTFVPTSTPGLVKLIDVTWKCQRHFFGTGANTNTETIQTAKIVIRN